MSKVRFEMYMSSIVQQDSDNNIAANARNCHSYQMINSIHVIRIRGKLMVITSIISKQSRLHKRIKVSLVKKNKAMRQYHV